jgi:hypothetical protein
MSETNPLLQNGPIMTDDEVARFFGLSKKTLQRRMLHPVTGELDLWKAQPQKIGGRRFWVRAKVEALVGITKGTSK